MRPYRIFIVEDDPWYGEILEYHLSLNPDNEVIVLRSAGECLDRLHEEPDLITIDFKLPDLSGEALFQKVRAWNPDVPVIVISGQEDVATAVRFLQSGAFDYIVKNDDTKDRIWHAANKARENRSLREEIEQLRGQLGQKFRFDQIIGQSKAVEEVFKLIEKAARTNINVSLTGETGTGKELVARAIHYNSVRKKSPFVAVNMAAIPKELLESELFGHEKGSFTGATARKIGRFEEANNGTLFLDEIGDLDLNLQSKLLRVLQEKELQRVGGSEKVNLNVRIIAATHRALFAEVEAGRFREDLFYRLMGLPIELPPLRDRGTDILLLAEYFINKFCNENQMATRVLERDAKDKLMLYSFPGNVRELKAVIDLACVMTENERITATDLRFNRVGGSRDWLSEELPLREYDRRIIQHFLKRYDGNVLLVAEKLDIGKSTIYKMIQNQELQVP